LAQILFNYEEENFFLSKRRCSSNTTKNHFSGNLFYRKRMANEITAYDDQNISKKSAPYPCEEQKSC